MWNFKDFFNLLPSDDENPSPFAGGMDLLENIELPSTLGAEGELIDLDGDGIPDQLIFQQPVDVDGDGIMDGIVTEVHLDTDGDGSFDSVRIDLSMDMDHDGLADIHSVFYGTDMDHDGIIDSMEELEFPDDIGSTDWTKLADSAEQEFESLGLSMEGNLNPFGLSFKGSWRGPCERRCLHCGVQVGFNSAH